MKHKIGDIFFYKIRGLEKDTDYWAVYEITDIDYEEITLYTLEKILSGKGEWVADQSLTPDEIDYELKINNMIELDKESDIIAQITPYVM
jgi:transcriptional regulatory protein LevR